MKSGQPVARCAAAAIFLAIGGCAVGSGGADRAKAPIIERDLLAEAARDVEAAEWPAPKSAPLMSWITGGGGEARFTKSDAVAFYVEKLQPSGAKFESLHFDARQKLSDAERLRQTAISAAEATRVSMNDITLVEDAIQALRDHRDIYAAAAKEIGKSGETVDEEMIDTLRRDFSAMIRELGKTADLLADRHDHDRSSTFAQPAHAQAADL